MDSFNIFDLPEGLRNRSIQRHPHTAGERSAQLAGTILAIPEQNRTPYQARLLLQHERGECIGCSRQGIPMDINGYALPLLAEPNGFAHPPLYCECPKGRLYEQEVEKRRSSYDQERVQEHQRYLRYLFGSMCILSPVRSGWTLQSWPVYLQWPDGWIEEEGQRANAMRVNLVENVQMYAKQLSLHDEAGMKRGIGLFGAPGVGKSVLLRCLEPLMLAKGLSMVSFYVPDLVVALESEQVEQMIAAIRATDVVLLDNLGSIVSFGYKDTQGRSALIRLINARWERQQRTFFTTNADEEQLVEQLGEDSVSRLHALCRFFIVPGVDLRQEGGD